MDRVLLPGSRCTPGTFRQFSGYRSCRVVQLEGTTVGVVVGACRSKDQALDDGRNEPPEFRTPFHALCESHGALVGCPTLASARWAAERPDGFCEECRAICDAPMGSDPT